MIRHPGNFDFRGRLALGGVDQTFLKPFVGPALWAVDGDGAMTQGGGIVGDVALTEAAAAYAVVEDYDAGGSDYQLLSTSATGAGYTANYQVLPDTEAIGDAIYLGNSVPFCEIAFNVSATNMTYGADAGKWQYWNGSAWADLTIVADRTDSTAGDGKRPFQQDGALSFIPPAAWAATTVNSQSAYWVKWVVTAAQATQIALLDSKEHYLVAPEDGYVVPYTTLLSGIRGIDQAATVHTNVVKFIVVNFTKGTHSGELTWAASKRQDAWTLSSLLKCDAGDVLGVLVTDEDGTNEVTNGILEFSGRLAK